MPPNDCWSAYRGKRFLHEGILHPISLNQLNILTSNPTGQIRHENGAMQCEGQKAKEGGIIVNDVIILEEIRLLVKEETFLRRGQEVQAGSDHLNLPCNFREGGCATGEGTFVWPSSENECDLVLVKSGQGRISGDDTLIMDKDKVAVQIKEAELSSECKIKNLHATNHENLFVSRTRDVAAAAEFHAGDFDPVLQAKTAAEFGLHELAERQRQGELGVFEPVCHRLQHRQPHQLVSLGEGKFAATAGQVIHVFQCREITVQIQESRKCYEDIPLKDPAGKFLDPATGLIKSHSATKTCNSLLPTIISTDQGWVKILPEIHPASAPLDKWTEQPEEGEFIDLAGAGAFTERESREWLASVNFPDFHVATLTEFTMRTCPGASSCPEEIRQQQDGNFLEWSSIQKSLDGLSPFAGVKDWAEKNSAYLSLSVIILVLGKILCQIIVIMAISAIDGVQGAKKALTNMMCGLWKSRKPKARPNFQVKLSDILQNEKELRAILDQHHNP